MGISISPDVDLTAEQVGWQCRYCGHTGAIRIAYLHAAPLGTYSVAGAMPKVAARVPDAPTARCLVDLNGCGRSMEPVRLLAYLLHAGQVDKQGVPYWRHLAAVEATVKARGGTVIQRIAALLHDSVEDDRTTLDGLAGYRVPIAALTLIDALTMRKGEQRADYIARILTTPDASLIKEADLDDNEGRLDGITDETTRDRLRGKYARDRAQIAEWWTVDTALRGLAAGGTVDDLSAEARRLLHACGHLTTTLPGGIRGRSGGYRAVLTSTGRAAVARIRADAEPPESSS